MFARKMRATYHSRKMSLTTRSVRDRECPEAYSDYPLPTSEQLDVVRKLEAERNGFGSGRWLVVEDIGSA